MLPADVHGRAGRESGREVWGSWEIPIILNSLRPSQGQECQGQELDESRPLHRHRGVEGEDEGVLCVEKERAGQVVKAGQANDRRTRAGPWDDYKGVLHTQAVWLRERIVRLV